MKINHFLRITATWIFLFMLTRFTISSQSITSGSVFNDPTPFEVESFKRVKQQMVAPPALPEHKQVASDAPVIVEMELIIEEENENR